jgi:rhodanese-related sulfurtransferase
MRIAALLAALAMTAAAATAVSATRSAQGADAIDAPRIPMVAFKQLVAAKNVVIVDTRNPDEFKAGHIAGALFLPLEGRLTWPDEYEPVVKQLIASRKPVVTYCA